MDSRIINSYEVCWNGRTVWVNGPDGTSRARYSERAGIDLHYDFKTQSETGRTCLACGPGDWPTFVGLVQTHLGFTVPPEAQP